MSDYTEIKKDKEPMVYVLQELPGTSTGRPKYNIMGALKYGKLKVLLKENTQIVLSPGPIVFELRRLLKNYTSKDYLLLSGDPSVIGIAVAIVSDINNGRFNLLKWDRQEKVYYPLEIDLYEKGKMEEPQLKGYNLMNNIDFEKDQTEVLDKTENIKSLASQVKSLKELEDELKADEESLKNKKKEIERISGEVIPTMLSEMGLSSLKLADGSAVDVKPYYAANISLKNREAAYNWLRSNGLGDIIKNEITVSFGRDEDNKATTYVNLAKGQGYQPTQKLKVEPMTLKALVRERIENGKDMPTDIFNVFVGNRTIIKRKQET